VVKEAFTHAAAAGNSAERGSRFPHQQIARRRGAWALTPRRNWALSGKPVFPTREFVEAAI
jgi:hypothetical protein